MTADSPSPAVPGSSTEAGEADESGPGAAAPGAPPFNRNVLIAAAAVFAVLMALSARYGFHRDELYFLDAPGICRPATSTSPS